jgi:[acyl-carrier-protein] S-malonyltransferase
LRRELASQVACSVQWTHIIEYLYSVGIQTFFEIGPGQALAGMIKRIVKGATILSIGSMLQVEQAVTYVRENGYLS